MSAQKGYILPLVLFGTVAFLSGIGLLFYFFFYRPQQQVVLTPLPTPNVTSSSTAIADFGACVKAGNPIMESYPRRCNADGKSFTEVIQVTPGPVASSSAEDISGWKKYENEKNGYSLKYPASLFTNCSIDDELYLFEGAEGSRGCGLGEEPTMFYMTTMVNSKSYQVSSNEQCYSVIKELLIIDGIQAEKYHAEVKSRTGACLGQEVAYADAGTHIDLIHNNKNYEIYYFKSVDKAVVEKMLESIKFLK